MDCLPCEPCPRIDEEEVRQWGELRVSGRDGGNVNQSENRAQVRENARGEHRLPAAIATLVAMLLYGFLPNSIQPLWLRLCIIGIAAVLLGCILVVNPARTHRNTRIFRVASLALATLLVSANLVALSHTVMLLVTTKPGDGPELLAAAAQVWATNFIAFSLLFWELDRGGPAARRQRPRSELPPADFRFPQDEDDDTSREVSEQSGPVSNWRPSYVDYWYDAAVTSMSFGPGAGVPLRPRAKILATAQGLMSFVLVTLVIAHAVGALGA